MTRPWGTGGGKNFVDYQFQDECRLDLSLSSRLGFVPGNTLDSCRKLTCAWGLRGPCAGSSFSPQGQLSEFHARFLSEARFIVCMKLLTWDLRTKQKKISGAVGTSSLFR